MSGRRPLQSYMARRRRPSSQGWRTFLRNHADGIASMDLFVVPTISFSLLHGFIILQHSRRALLWVGVTAHPSAEWIARLSPGFWGYLPMPLRSGRSWAIKRLRNASPRRCSNSRDLEFRGPAAAAWLRVAGYFPARVMREKSFDFEPAAADVKPSAISPRFSSSRIADARLGIRRANRQSSTVFNSSAVSMIWSRSPLFSSPIVELL